MGMVMFHKTVSAIQPNPKGQSTIPAIQHRIQWSSYLWYKSYWKTLDFSFFIDSLKNESPHITKTSFLDNFDNTALLHKQPILLLTSNFPALKETLGINCFCFKGKYHLFPLKNKNFRADNSIYIIQTLHAKEVTVQISSILLAKWSFPWQLCYFSYTPGD